MLEADTDGNKFLRELWALTLVFLCLIIALSLISYSPHDPTLNQQVGAHYVLQNQAGLVGAYLAGFVVDLFGLGCLAIPFIFAFGAASCLVIGMRLPWWRWVGFLLLFCFTLYLLHFSWLKDHIRILSIGGGGFVGYLLQQGTVIFFRPLASVLFWGFIFLIGLQLSFGLTWSTIILKIRGLVAERIAHHEEGGKVGNNYSIDSTVLTNNCPSKPVTDADFNTFFPGKTQKSGEDSARDSSIQALSEVPQASTKQSNRSPNDRLKLPSIDYLDKIQESRHKVDLDHLNSLSQKVGQCLANFGVQGTVERVQPGPVVTMVEFKPAPGVKINKIAVLNDDLALALKAPAVRIIAPIPGKDTVGIEIPNEERQTVFFREIIESEPFSNSNSPLTLALGKEILGQPRVADLGRMPHLLIAGATGAGKSVCINTIILSLLFKSDPDRLKMLLIDPKRIELAMYEGLPHLVHPVVTDMSLAKSALDWAVHEMERRYEVMALLGVRNIDSYNIKRLTVETPSDQSDEPFPNMPYLAVIIDELADLMLTSAKEVEVSIVRLAQLARAAGIHLILATQRPSVDVVTGIIKANFPARISFQVSSKHDSRTILDTIGAEYLLGMGDMLFKGGDGRLTRIHGAYVSDREISRVIEFWKDASPPCFDVDFREWQKETQKINGVGTGGEDVSSDPQYAEALEFVTDQGKASISLIQRRFRIGFNKAARFIEQMEKEGIIGPQEGSKPRTVLR